MSAEPPREPPVYRPFALLAFGTTLLAGTPIGVWLLAWLYWEAPAPTAEWLLLHAHLQTVGFFGTLIVGVAPHLLARFAGRPVLPPPRWLAPALAAALLLRLAGAWSRTPEGIILAALVQAAAFAVFGARVWRALDPPPLAPLRRQLGLASAWLALACLGEAAARGAALAAGHALPGPGMLRTLHAMALFGGVTGWMLGVLLRAGPMFVPDWRVAPRVARAAPWLLALGIALVAAGETGLAGRAAAGTVALAGQAVALAAVLLVAASAGAWRRAPRALPMLTRSPEEARVFRLALACAALALLGSLAGAALAPRAALTHLLEDALRHLVTVGFLAGVVVAMAFRLVPVLEARPLPWPRLRALAFWSLLAAVVTRSAEPLLALGLREVALFVPLSGLLAWITLACVGVTLVGAASHWSGSSK